MTPERKKRIAAYRASGAWQTPRAAVATDLGIDHPPSSGVLVTDAHSKEAEAALGARVADVARLKRSATPSVKLAKAGLVLPLYGPGSYNIHRLDDAELLLTQEGWELEWPDWSRFTRFTYRKHIGDFTLRSGELIVGTINDELVEANAALDDLRAGDEPLVCIGKEWGSGAVVRLRPGTWRVGRARNIHLSEEDPFYAYQLRWVST